VRPGVSNASSSQQLQIPPAIAEKGAGSSTRLQLPPAIPSNKAGGSSTRISLPPAVKNPGGSGVQPAQRPGSSPRNPVPPAGKSEGSLSSGKLQIPPAPEKGLGSSTRIQLPPAAKGGVSSSRLGLPSETSSAVMEATRARAKRSTGEPPPLRISWLWVGVGFLLLSGLMAFIFTRARIAPAAVGESKEENEAIARLRAGPRTSEDMRTVQRLFFKIKEWKDVEALIGAPDYTLKGTIPLWSPDQGSYEIQGVEFRAYKISDPNSQLPGGEESPIQPILLFQIMDNGSVQYLEPIRMYAIKELPEHWKKGTLAAPSPGNNPVPTPGADPSKGPPLEMPPKSGPSAPVVPGPVPGRPNPVAPNQHPK
jgi:hypothetical protein